MYISKLQGPTGFGKRHLSTGAPLANPKGGLVYRGRWTKEGSGEPGGRASSLGTLKDVYRKALQKSSLTIEATLGNLEEGFI